MLCMHPVGQGWSGSLCVLGIVAVRRSLGSMPPHQTGPNDSGFSTSPCFSPEEIAKPWRVLAALVPWVGMRCSLRSGLRAVPSAQGIKFTCDCVCLTWVQLPAFDAALPSRAERRLSCCSALGNFLVWLSQGPAYTRYLGVGQGVKLACSLLSLLFPLSTGGATGAPRCSNFSESVTCWCNTVKSLCWWNGSVGESAKPDDANLMAEGENQLPQVVLRPPHARKQT